MLELYKLSNESVPDPRFIIEESRHQEGQAEYRGMRLPGGGYALAIEPTPTIDGLPWAYQRYIYTPQFEIRLDGILKGKAPTENRVGCGDHTHIILMRYPGLFTMLLLCGSDALPPAWRSGWQERLEKAEVDLNPTVSLSRQKVSLLHPDIVHAVMERDWSQSEEYVKWIQTTADNILAAVYHDIDILSHGEIFPLKRHPYGDLENAARDIHWDVIVSKTLFFRRMIDDFFGKTMQKMDYNDIFLSWYFNAIFAHSCVIIPEYALNPNVLKRPQFITSSFRSNADMMSHAWPLDMSGASIPISSADSNASIDGLIRLAQSLGKISEKEREMLLIGKTRSVYATYPVDVFQPLLDGSFRANMETGTTTLVHTFSVTDELIAGVATDGMLSDTRDQDRITNLSGNYLDVMGKVYREGAQRVSESYDKSGHTVDDRGLLLAGFRINYKIQDLFDQQYSLQGPFVTI